jgi:hypothetical protein
MELTSMFLWLMAGSKKVKGKIVPVKVKGKVVLVL